MSETFELPNGKTLHRWNNGYSDWACMQSDHGPFCRMCQEVDETLDACLQNVIDGGFEAAQDPRTGEFQFRLTDEGWRRTGHIVRQIADPDEGGEPDE